MHNRKLYLVHWLNEIFVGTGWPSSAGSLAADVSHPHCAAGSSRSSCLGRVLPTPSSFELALGYPSSWACLVLQWKRLQAQNLSEVITTRVMPQPPEVPFSNVVIKICRNDPSCWKFSISFPPLRSCIY